MTNRSYQARGPVSRSVLITVRVSPEDRERLNQLAQERGETLSRMLVARWLPARKRAKRQELARRCEAVEAAAIGAPTCAPEPPLSVRPDAERMRDASAPLVQGSLFDAMGGR